jgi:hypothetical protein
MRRATSCLRTTMLWAAAAAAVFVSSACADDVPTLVSGGESASGSSTASSSGSSSTSTASSTSTGPADGTGTTGTASTGAVFVPPNPDFGGLYECDIWAQDCPSGEKCMPWDRESETWNATRCSPIVDDPGAPGESCHVEGLVTSGIDDCELGAMCWHVDPRTNEGICRGICHGTYEAYYCENPEEYCALGSNWLITLCLPLCDPLVQDCPDGKACYPIQDVLWVCGTDGSEDMGAYGDPCEVINVCAPGLTCVDASAVPPGLPCEGAAGCCTEVCDITDPLGDQQCMGAAEGQTCQPWYEEDEAPLVLDHVGVCTLP